MPKGSQGVKRPNKEDSSSSQHSKASRHTACSVCRERKIRCDGTQPSCSRCKRLGHQCSYMITRKNDASKLAQALETLDARLAHAEARLATQSSSESSLDQLTWPSFDAEFLNGLQPPQAAEQTDPHSDINDLFPPLPSSETSSEHIEVGKRRTNLSNIGEAAEDTMPLFLSSLGSDIHSSPPREELTQVYFDTLHRCFPMVNQARFRSLSTFLSTDRGITSLSNAIWLHAASMIPEKYARWEEHCYRSARHHLEKLETEENDGTFMSIDALQAVVLVALYEFKQMHFARAWLTIGKAMRLAQMFGLHKMDGNLLTNQDSGFQSGLHPTTDWTQLEERRRTFWVAFNVDWYASSRTASPMNIDDEEITTFLPSMDALDGDQRPPPIRLQLKDALRQPLVSGSITYSAFAGAVVMAGFCGRCLRHLQRAHKALAENDYTYDFWSNHYSIDLAINQTLLSPLKHLNITMDPDSIDGMTDPNTIFLNMNMRATIICLHQAAVVQAERSTLPATLIGESESRSLTAAQEIANIMKLVRRTSVHLSKLNMFTTWCLYTAARVLVATLRSARSSTDILDSLQTILSALNSFKISNPRTELFINQINMELGGPLSNPRRSSGSPYRYISSIPLDTTNGTFSTPLTPVSVTGNSLTTYDWLGIYDGQE